MVILKRIKSSSLLETLIATILIIVVFIMASLILNSIFSNSITNNTSKIKTHFKELHYLYIHDKLPLPYYDDFNSWTIQIDRKEKSDVIEFTAINKATSKEFTVNYGTY